MRNIGMLSYIPRYGGGTYQLTENVMCALRDYAEARNAVRIHCYHGVMETEELRRLERKFPGFLFHGIGRLAGRLSAVQKRAFIALPPAISALRYLYPLNWLTWRHRIELLLFPGSAIDACFYRGRQWFMFTDLAHVFYPQFPELAAKGELRRRNIIFKYGLRYASQIVVESTQLRRDAVSYYGADPAKIAVLPQTVPQALVALGLQAEDAECADFRRALPQRYLFYPAQLWEHKNHKNLLYAFKILKTRHRDLQLILVGSRKDGDEKIFHLVDELGLSDSVRWMGYVPDKFIPILYRNACALVKPGYVGPTNIPTLEAFYFGCPAVISDLPGVREQTADAALFFDPDSPEDIAAKVDLVLSDAGLREDLVRRGCGRLKILGYETYRSSFAAILDANLDFRPSQST